MGSIAHANILFFGQGPDSLRGIGCLGIAALVGTADVHIKTNVKFIDRIGRAITGLGRLLRRVAISLTLLLTQAILLLCFASGFTALAYGMGIHVSPLIIILFSALPIFYQG